MKLEVKAVVQSETNDTMYRMVSTQLYQENSRVFDGLDELIAVGLPICNFVIVAVATSATVVQLKRVIAWRQGASANADGTEVVCRCRKSVMVVVNSGGDSVAIGT